MKKSFSIPAPKTSFSIPAPNEAFSLPAPKRAFSAKPEEGQRDKVLRITGESPEGSVGEAIHAILKEVMETVPVGNLLAGRSGDFFEQNRALLNAPATESNIKKWADAEAKFWETQPPAERRVGALFITHMRIAAITNMADALALKRKALKAVQKALGGPAESSREEIEERSYMEEFRQRTNETLDKLDQMMHREPSVTVRRVD